MAAKKKISEDVISFKEICTALYNEQSVDYSYEKIVNMVLKTEHGNFIKSEDVTLEEIAYIFDITRQRSDQVVKAIIKKLSHPQFIKKWQVIKDQMKDSTIEFLSKDDILRKAQDFEEKKERYTRARENATRDKANRSKINRDNPMNLLGRVA